MLMATFDILDFKKFQNIFTGHFFPIGTDPGTFRFFKISVFDILPPDLMYGLSMSSESCLTTDRTTH